MAPRSAGYFKTMNSLDLLKNYLDQEGYRTSFDRLFDKSANNLIVASPDNKHSALVTPFIGGSNLGRKIAQNKLASYSLAERLSIRIPKTLSLTSAEEAKNKETVDFLQEIVSKNRSVIVKPSDAQRSKGLTRGISSVDELFLAITNALEVGSIALVQEQILGEEIRITCVDGRVVSVLLRERPQVCGDGISTVGALIEEENIKRGQIASLVPYPNLPQEDLYMGTSADYIPRINEKIVLGPASMIKDGASVYEIIDQTDASVKDVGKKIATFLPVGVLSIDLIVESPEQPLSSSNYALIEINTGPSLLLYYSCKDGKNCNIIENYLGERVKSHLKDRNIFPDIGLLK